MMKVCTALSLFIVLSCAGCARDEAMKYFPLNENAKWEYTLAVLVPPGNVINGVLVVRLDGIEEIKGKEYSKEVSVSSGIPGAETSYRYLRTDGAGVYAIDGENMEFGEYLFAPAALQAGVKWEVIGSKSKQSCSVERFEPADLIDKKFENCARIKCNGEFEVNNGSMPFESTEHRCPKVGLVKQNVSVVMGFSKVNISQSLSDFER